MKLKRKKKEMKMEMHQAVLYHRKAKGGVKIWNCSVVDEEVWSSWGQQGGEVSHTKERPGKKRNQTARERAVALFEKKVEKKMKKGYVEKESEIMDDIRVDDDTMNFDRLPRSFAPGKPIKTYKPDELARLAKEDKLFIQRKRDGMRHYLVSDTKGRIRVYSSGKDDMTEHLQPLLEGIKLPVRTILDCELVVTNENGGDEFNLVAGIARSLSVRAVSQIQEAMRQGMRVQLFAFDLLWEKDEPTYKCQYMDRYRRLARVIDDAVFDNLEEYNFLERMPLLTISPTRLATLAEGIDLVKKHKWEGLVVWRKDQATSVQMNGCPKRINCWKVKPIKEEDVIATGYELGKGKNSKVVGAFNIALFDSSKKNYATSFEKALVSMGNCGTGLDDATRKAALTWKYPCVIQIEYDQKSETGFRFPVFIRKRDDKKVSECVA